MILILVISVLLAAVFGWMRKSRPRRHEVRRRQAESVRETVGNGTFLPAQAFAYLRKMNPYAFEELVLDGFGKAGYEVRRNRMYSADGGVDGHVSRDGKEYLVQCKRYAGYISRKDVEDFSRLCTRECREGFFVHTGKTGAGSREVVSGTGNVRIVSGDEMLRLVGFRLKEDVLKS